MFEFADLFADFDAKLISGEREGIINLDKFEDILEKEKKIMNRGKRRVDTPGYAGKERKSARKSNIYLINLLDCLSSGIIYLW